MPGVALELHAHAFCSASVPWFPHACSCGLGHSPHAVTEPCTARVLQRNRAQPPPSVHAAAEACMLPRKPEACTLARIVLFAARAQVFHTQHARTTDAYHAQHMSVPNMHATAYCTALCACCVPRAVYSGWYTYCVLQPDVRRVSSAVLRASGALRSVSVTHEYSTSRYPRPAGRCAFPPEPTRP